MFFFPITDKLSNKFCRQIRQHMHKSLILEKNFIDFASKHWKQNVYLWLIGNKFGNKVFIAMRLGLDHSFPIKLATNATKW